MSLAEVRPRAGRPVASPRDRVRAWLGLARISNAPTVVSDSVAGAVVVAGSPSAGRVALVAAAMVAFYTAGMILNDWCDRALDARVRPERPLPSGVVTPAAALGASVALFAAGLAVLAALDWRAFVAGLGLVALIVLYDAWHKGVAVSPLIMASTRFMVYVVAGFAAGPHLPVELLLAGAVLLVYTAGLTQLAKAEVGGDPRRLWPLVALALPVLIVAWAPDAPAIWIIAAAFAAWTVVTVRGLGGPRRDVGAAVGRSIAAIALVDALVIAAADGPAVALAVAVVAFGVTVALQRKVAGT